MKSLSVITNQITEHHLKAQAHAESAVKHAIEAGKLLLEAKDNIEHGQWLAFLETIQINPRTAQRYMKVANNEARLENDSMSHLSMTKALEVLSEPKDPVILDDQHLYLNGMHGETWIWPHGEWFHYVSVSVMSDESMTVTAFNRPISWEGIKYFVSDIEKMELVEGFAYVGQVFRDAGLSGEFNHGENYNPEKPYVE